jgi:hypothetical protein
LLVGPPRPPSFLFLIDVSNSAVDNGLVTCVCNTLGFYFIFCTILLRFYSASKLDSLLAISDRTLVSVITYGRNITFYPLHPAFYGSEGQTGTSKTIKPKVFVCADVDNLIFPVPTQFTAADKTVQNNFIAPLKLCKVCF